jgi:small-conductance mechanosensitive channel
MRYLFNIKGVFLSIFFLLGFFDVLSAQDSTVSNTLPKQVKEQVGNRLDTSATSMIEHLERYANLLNKANNLLQDGLDTTSIAEKLPEYEQILQLTQLALNNQVNNLNMRALNSTRVILRQLKKELKDWQEKLFDYTHALADLSQQITFIDSNLLASYSATSELKLAYTSQFADITQKWQNAKPVIQNTLFLTSTLQGKITRLYLLSGELISECERNIKTFTQKAFLKEEPYLYQTKQNHYTFSFTDVFRKTSDRAFYLLTYYFSNTWTTRAWNILITLAIWLILSRLLRNVQSNPNHNSSGIIVLKKSILLSCILIACTLAPFIYVSPPAIYVELLWYVMACITLVLNWDKWTNTLKQYWLGFLVLMLLFSIDSLLLFSSYAERFGLALLNIAAIVLGYFIQKHLKRSQKDDQPIFRYALYFFIALNGLAIICNLFGRFTLAKLFSSTSDTSLALAITLGVIKEILLESIFLLIESNRKSLWFTSRVEFEDIRKKMDPVLKITAVILWLMTVAWGMNIYEFLAARIGQFMNEELSIGNFHFSLINIAIFLMILWVSNLLAGLLTVIFRDEASEFALNRKNKTGSWILLLKLLIYILGFFLAVSAAGIPIDKIAIVIGALGVGIGFGLQNIVNNLVSGVILAFEKPMTIGDVIEVGNRMGTVKEIGIRSSKINTYEGAEIIVPNGELISSQLINWTRNNSYKRVEIIVGVSYKTDIAAAKKVAADILHQLPGILHYPHPAVLLHELADSSVNLRLLFWAENFDEWTKLKSEVIQEILQQFSANKIEIPFPQRDIHITHER